MLILRMLVFIQQKQQPGKHSATCKQDQGRNGQQSNVKEPCQRGTKQIKTNAARYIEKMPLKQRQIKQADKRSSKQTHKQPSKDKNNTQIITDRQAGRQAGSQTDKEANKDTQKDRELTNRPTASKQHPTNRNI